MYYVSSNTFSPSETCLLIITIFGLFKRKNFNGFIYLVNNCLKLISQTNFTVQSNYFTNSSQISSLVITDQNLLLNYLCAFSSITIGLNSIAFKFIITILVNNKIELVIFPEPISQRSRNFNNQLNRCIVSYSILSTSLFVIEELLVSPLG